MPAVYTSQLDYEEGVALTAIGPAFLAEFEAMLQAGPPPCHLCPLYNRWAAVGDLRCSAKAIMPCLRAIRKLRAAVDHLHVRGERVRLRGRPHRPITCRACGKRFMAAHMGPEPESCPDCRAARRSQQNTERVRRLREDARQHRAEIANESPPGPTTE